MADTKTRDLSHIRFESTAFPTDDDMRLWYSLSGDEQVAVIKRDLDEAEAGGAAESEPMEQILERVRKETRRKG